MLTKDIFMVRSLPPNVIASRLIGPEICGVGKLRKQQEILRLLNVVLRSVNELVDRKVTNLLVEELF
eukprot:SAG22_NODE_54_length_23787_cov_12.917511_8_plen_67_part_00